MVRRAEPLLVDILVATLAGVRFHKKFAGNLLPAVDLSRAWEEGPLRAIAFGVHGGRRKRRIVDGEAELPARFARVFCSEAQCGEDGKTKERTKDSRARAGCEPSASSC